MTTTTFFSPKGGTGTSTVAAAVAVGMSRTESTALVGDLPELCAILGVLHQERTVQATPTLTLIDQDEHDFTDDKVWDRAGVTSVVIDAGTRPAEERLIGRKLLVVRPCFLALRRATQGPRADGIVLVEEDGRALGASDVEAALGIPVLANVPVEPSIARAIDAGILAVRLPRMLSRALAPIVQGVTAE